MKSRVGRLLLTCVSGMTRSESGTSPDPPCSLRRGLAKGQGVAVRRGLRRVNRALRAAPGVSSIVGSYTDTLAGLLRGHQRCGQEREREEGESAKRWGRGATRVYFCRTRPGRRAWLRLSPVPVDKVRQIRQGCQPEQGVTQHSGVARKTSNVRSCDGAGSTGQPAGLSSLSRDAA